MQSTPKKKGEPVRCLVPLPKEGPVAPRPEPTKGKEFVVIAGTIPPAAASTTWRRSRFMRLATPIGTYCWAPHGRFLALCGFGNLAGDVDFWDRNKKKKIGSVNMPCAVEYGWSPDSRLFVTATTAPRMNVDNGIHVYRYDGSGPLSTTKDRDPLFDCFWLPGVTDDYPDRGVSPASSAHARRAKERPRAPMAARRARPEGRRVAGVDDSGEREKDKGSPER